ncbi:MAG: radical SAM protein, partial [Ignavibacteria bacterium]|nr:radical SAM protein [Ignavibacteria bacterium]
KKLQYLNKSGEKTDYITFISDGEPTLDVNIGKSIEKLKSTGIKIAVITNSSLLWDKETRNNLMKADLVSVKIDTADSEIWHSINRPHGCLNLDKIITGIIDFSKIFSGKLVTETMLVKDINDGIKSVTETAKIIGKINPAVSYILVPTRPPAESYVSAPSEDIINNAFQIFNKIAGKTELIIYSEGTEFTFTGDKERELIGILGVHPMQYDAVHEYLRKSNSDIKFVNRLIKDNILTKVKYGNNYFLMKKF